jgi:chorismate mutase
MSENAVNANLAAFRKQIDELDDKLIRLLIERIGVVERVGAMKRSESPGVCPIRAGREAEQIRRIMQRFEGLRNDTLFPAAAAAIWRLIIGMSTSIEASPLKVSAFTPIGDRDLYWLAREYFGPFISVVRQSQINRVIGDVIDGKAAVGVLPVIRSSDATNWWINLMDEGPDVPKVFARIPFVINETAGRDAPAGLAIARLKPETSGNDVSLWMLEADYNVSQHRLQTAFATAKLEGTWINISTLHQLTRHHLIEVKGFIPSGHEAMTALVQGLGKAIVNVGFLGADAVPVTLKTETPEIKSGIHAPVFAKT